MHVAKSNLFYICLLEYDGVFKLENRACKRPFGKFPTMKAAIDKCAEDHPCVVVDDNCNDVNEFRLCTIPDLIKTTDSHCSYFKPAAG